MPNESQDWRPRPDPTVLTTEQLHREIAALESRIGSEVSALKTLLEASIRSVTTILDGKTEELETKVSCATDLSDTRFDRIDTRFDVIERHRVEQKEDTDKRLGYVIDTLKERADEHYKSNRALIEKSEQSVLDTIAKQGDSFQASVAGLITRNDDLKERVGKIENIKEGAQEQKTEGRQQISSTTAIVGTVIAVIAVGLALLVGRNSDQSTPTITTPTVTVEQRSTPTP